MANSVDKDQATPKEAVLPWSTLFAMQPAFSDISLESKVVQVVRLIESMIELKL